MLAVMNRLSAAEFVGRLEHLLKLFQRHGVGRVGFLFDRNDNDELVASPAADLSVFAYCFCQALRDRAQNRIAEHVAEGVVDLAKSVKIDVK